MQAIDRTTTPNPIGSIECNQNWQQSRSPFVTKSLGGLMNFLMNPHRVQLSLFYSQSVGLGIGESVRPHAARICTLTQKKLAPHQ
ncbi:MAG: hypothetical protein EAZ59_26020 [Oscillatoriales cyanobacterium]|nr:MAG: hypothetical protein EAZ96_15895 [Oscillatoriales cyanobacterium]TAF41074.1 MAG: hypothetical protein EAZ68_10720 [Oscillatoriales cyanobacterium]TAF61043.1 MAG: hypothetical protein EAZ59_26020 [Oscillatoriales cyanobacterium]